MVGCGMYAGHERQTGASFAGHWIDSFESLFGTVIQCRLVAAVIDTLIFKNA